MKNILKNINLNYFNYYNLKVLLDINKYKNFRGSIIEVKYFLPEFYKVNKLKKSKKKKQISFGKLRSIFFCGRCISKRKSSYNYTNNFIIRNVMHKISIELLLYGNCFFFYDFFVRVKKKITKSKLYYLRIKPKKYSIVKFLK